MLVEIESPSSDKAAVDEVLTMFAEWAQESGGGIRRHRHRQHGDSLEVSFRDSHHEQPVMLLGHLDTV